MLLNCRHIIFTFCAFPRNWVPAFKLNTSELVPLLPGRVLYVWGTNKKGGTVTKNGPKTVLFIEVLSPTWPSVFVFFWPKRPLAAATEAGRDKKMLKNFLAALLLSASVKRVGVSCMRDFFLHIYARAHTYCLNLL